MESAVRRYFLFALAYCVLGACFGLTQTSPASEPEAKRATCDIDEGKELAINYPTFSLNSKDKKNLGDKLPYKQVWKPGNQPMALFTNTPVSVGGTTLATGAYTLYLIPERKQWTLIVSKNTDLTAAYDPSKDLVRAPMQVGTLLQPSADFSVYFEHSGRTECTLRVDIAETGAWVPFQEK
jgi:hypothetical protein